MTQRKGIRQFRLQGAEKKAQMLLPYHVKFSHESGGGANPAVWCSWTYMSGGIVAMA